MTDIWDGQPHRLYPDRDFFSAKYIGRVEPVSEAEGDARLETALLSDLDLRIASVNQGFNAYATRLKRIAEACGVEIRIWYSTSKGVTPYAAHKLAPPSVTEYWVQTSSPVDEELRNVLA